MKIQTSYPVNNYQATQSDNKTKIPTEQKQDKDQYIPGNDQEKLTYGKTSNSGQISIQKLREESEKAYESLRRLVMEMIQKQRVANGDERLSGDALEAAMGKYVVSAEELQMEPALLIADDGPLGAEAVSQRIVDFAISISGGDKSKLNILRDAIDEGFKQAKDILGGQLPEVSQKTYSLIMEKLDKWEND